MYYRTLNENLKHKFGQKVYKLALSGGMTCPNRDGTVGWGGCIFCSGGSGEFAQCGSSVTEQIKHAKGRVASKITNGKYIAYFQSYTNTYADIYYLERIFWEAINHPDIAALSIATRPDCLEPVKIELLCTLARIKPVTVELGLQTVHERTAQYIRRGYPLSVYDDAMVRLKKAGLETVTHVILFLPGESEDMMLKTVRHVAKAGSDGIKLQLLHVLKNTDLARDYEKGVFKLPEMDEYIAMLEKCVRALPEHMVIHRLTGDGAKRELIAPMWSADKKRVLNAINTAFCEHNVVQGQNYNG